MSALPLTPPTPPAPPTPDTAISGTDIAADCSPAAGSHSAHSAHPDALRERAVALLCEGLRSPAIAAQLGVSERTVRAWLADARRAFAQQDAAADSASLHERLALAVERQLAIAAAAWQSYHHAVQLDQLALDHHRVIAKQAPDRRTLTGEVPPPPPPPRPSTASARFLSVALAAQREAARLQGCYDYPTRPTPSARVGMDPVEHVASTSRPQSPLPAETAIATRPSSAASTPPSPATPATAPHRQPDCAVILHPNSSPSSVSSVSSLCNPRTPRIPAKTATAPLSSPPLPPPALPTPPLLPRESPSSSPHAIHASPPPHAWQRIL